MELQTIEQSNSPAPTSIVIGLVGVERAGKDTVADYLIANYNFKKHSMADPIREISKIMFGWNESQLSGPDKDIIDPVTNIKPRDFFKWFGTDICQFELYKKFPAIASVIPPRTIWAKIMRQFITQTRATHNIIIPDIRFVHEAEELLAAGGILIRLNRHLQETEDQVNKYDLRELMTNPKYICPAHAIDNNTDLVGLYDSIDSIYTELSTECKGLASPVNPALVLDTSNCSLFI